ncbi:MAG: hypothetical protein E6I27_03855 [Chloroflexi bacterium]|nr:MAG: hypothetical protein E6I96_15085 [Chloroflexota bacterium]TMF38793.1 MAG: hypothetical protein E6I27_03855 [Chloroflexota bacterium]
MSSRSRRWVWIVAAAALLGVGCGPAPPFPVAIASTPPSQSTSRPLALVTLRGNDQVIVSDLTDISYIKTLASVGTSLAPVFVSASELSYADESGLVRAPLAGAPKTVVSGQVVGLFGWSPDGSSVVYTTESAAGMDVHQLTAGVDRVLGSAPSGGVGGCETIAGCAIANSLDFRLVYSPDGTYVSLVVSGFAPSTFRLWSADGKLVRSTDAQGTTMSVWSGGTLYFRDAGGVEMWRNGAVSNFLPGVAWIRPKASPDGGKIVYAARDSSGWAHSYVVDTTTREIREIKTARAEPIFLTSRYIWYRGERACVETDLCGPQPPTHPSSGTTYIYDLQNGTETETAITSVSDVWPHAA